MKFLIEMEYPETCDKCKFYKRIPYICHNERGYQSECALGYMKAYDMREIDLTDKKFKACRLDEIMVK